MDYKIISHWVKISPKTVLRLGNIVGHWDKEARVNYEYTIENITKNTITLRTMSIDGLAVKKEQRAASTGSVQDLVTNNFHLIDDKTNDQHKWPRTMEEAVKKLYSQYTPNELQNITNMSWDQFNNRYNVFGGLGMWIRNYFGLYRGNYDLAVDCNIEEPSADNVSEIIAYYFWEFVKEHKSR